jgi:hypothetical protein
VAAAVGRWGDAGAVRGLMAKLHDDQQGSRCTLGLPWDERRGH